MLTLPRPSTLLFFFATFLGIFGFGEMLLYDQDTYWHLAAGQLILDNGYIPTTDPFSFTAEGQRWLLLSWAWDALLAQFYRWQGMFGIVYMSALVYAVTLTLCFTTARDKSGDVIAAMLATILVMLGIELYARPQEITFLMVMAFAALLQPAVLKQYRREAAIAFPLLMVIWVNFHGAFTAGFVILGMHWLAAQIMQKRKDRNYFAYIIGACFIASLLNPYGIYAWRGVAWAVSGFSKELIVEWSGLRFSLMMLLTKLFIVLFVVLVPPTDRRFTLGERLVAYAWLFLGLSSIRHLPIFYLVASPMLAVALKSWLQSGEKRDPWPPLQELADKVMQVAPLMTTRVLALCFIALFCLLAPAPGMKALLGADDYRPQQALQEEAVWIRNNMPNGRFLNHYNVGGALIHGSVKTFVDARAEAAFPPAVLADYLTFHYGEEGWDKLLDKYRISGAVIPKTDPAMVDRFRNRSGWRLAFTGKDALVFLRVSR